MKNVLDWFEIYTSDFERAKRFYSDVFQCKLLDMPVDNERHPGMQYAAFSNDGSVEGASGALVKLDVAGPGVGGTLVYFRSGDIAAELGRVEAAGGKIIRPKLHIDNFGYIALIEDTEGNMIGLRSLS